MRYQYKTKGTCSHQIDLELDGETIRKVTFHGGCNGNQKGISALIQGANARDVIARCKGITCGMKATSCPDQLARALEEALASDQK